MPAAATAKQPGAATGSAGKASGAHLPPPSAADNTTAALLERAPFTMPSKPVALPPSIAVIAADRSITRGPSVSSADDAFGRVIVGDAPAAVRRRGEAYMFWCMDRPTAGAGIRPAREGVAAADAEPAAWAAADSCGGGDGAPVLIAMMAGDAAQWVESASDEDVLGRVMEGLRAMFGSAAVPDPTAHVITRWASDRWAGMSYSYLGPGAHGLHYDLMAAPVGGTQLLFAGEATNRHHPTTAAGAFDSGVREAVRLGRAWGKSVDSGVERVLGARAARLKAQGLPGVPGVTPLMPSV